VGDRESGTRRALGPGGGVGGCILLVGGVLQGGEVGSCCNRGVCWGTVFGGWFGDFEGMRGLSSERGGGGVGVGGVC
jgi:hypothetical protein